MKTNQIIIAIIVVLLLIGGAFYIKSTQMGNQSPLSQSLSTQMPSNLSSTDSKISASSNPIGSDSVTTQGISKEFTITGSNFKFDPAILTVNKGDTVKINFTSASGFHNWVVDAFNASSWTIS